MTATQIRAHALEMTPDTLEWDCFTFGIIQHAGFFTFYASIDHLHIDGVSAGLIFLDIHSKYEDLRQSVSQNPALPLPQLASYRDYAGRQREMTSRLTLNSPEIQDWIEFATAGRWPSFPLPLGDTRAHSNGDYLTVELLGAVETERFDAACRAARSRFVGGTLACAALAEHELTGIQTYRNFTPCDTRMPGVDTVTVGWFASLVPVTVPAGAGSFPDAARAAQKSFDAAKRLSGVPFERVLELTPADQLGLKPGTKPSTMMSFLDVRKIPLAAWFEEANIGTYGDNLSHGETNLWITRHAAMTTATISFPDNPVARASVQQYLEALIQQFASVVNASAGSVNPTAAPDNSFQLSA